MLLIAGAEDKTVPPAQTLEMAERLKAAGVSHELIVLPTAGHVFAGKTPEQGSEATQKALTATVAFIGKTVGGTPSGLNQP